MREVILKTLMEIEELFGIDADSVVDKEKTDDALNAEIRAYAEEIGEDDRFSPDVVAHMLGLGIELPPEVQGDVQPPEETATVDDELPELPTEDEEPVEAPRHEPSNPGVFEIDPEQRIMWHHCVAAVEELVKTIGSVGLADLFMFLREYQPERPPLDVLSEMQKAVVKKGFIRKYRVTETQQIEEVGNEA